MSRFAIALLYLGCSSTRVAPCTAAGQGPRPVDGGLTDSGATFDAGTADASEPLGDAGSPDASQPESDGGCLTPGGLDAGGSTFDGGVPSWSVSTGQFHTCAVRSTGELRCWGANRYGELGDDTDAGRVTPGPVFGVPFAVQVSAGGGGTLDGHTCALLSGGEVRCWGRNTTGQLGNDSGVDSLTPVAVLGLTDAVELDTGSRHSCARRATSEVVCWGYNGDAALGDGSLADRWLPVPVRGLSGAVQITTGSWHSCALKADGHVWCWGGNGYGEVGKGDRIAALSPAEVLGVEDAVEVRAGSGFTIARRKSGRVAAWGTDEYGQLGVAATACGRGAKFGGTAVDVAGISDAVGITAGGAWACALRATGQVWCWGSNANGWLGAGTGMTFEFTPVPVQGLADAVQIDSKGHHCAVRASGGVVCWGRNSDGQLGTGTRADATSPQAVNGLF